MKQTFLSRITRNKTTHDMNRKSFRMTLALLLAVVGLPLSTLRAQEIQVTVLPKMDPMPPQVMNYISQPGNYFNITLNNTSTEVMNVFLTLEVEQIVNGQLRVFTPYYLQPNTPITLPPNTPTPVTSVALQNQFRQLETSDVVLTGGQLSDFYGSGIVGLLPEGTYQAKIVAYKWEPGVKYPQMVSNPMSGMCTFNVCYSAQSPEITVPFFQGTESTVTSAQLNQLKNAMSAAYEKIKKATTSSGRQAAKDAYETAKKKYETAERAYNDNKWQACIVDNAAATFAWTVPIMTCGGSTKSYKYDLEFFPINSSMKTPEQAVKVGTVAETVKGLMTPTCVLTPAQISKIQQYSYTGYFVARVTATPQITDKNNINYSTIENDGHSQLLVFRFSDSVIVAPDNDSNDSGKEEEKKEDNKKDEEEEVVVIPTTPAISEGTEEDETASFIIFPPKLTTPDIKVRGVLAENDKVVLKWEKPEVKTFNAGAKDLLYNYNVRVYKKSSLQSLEQALQTTPIIKKDSLTALQYTVSWEDLKTKVKINDNLVYAVTANCTNEASISVEEDRRNIYQQAYADLSDKSAGMADCYADAANNITNRELAVMNEKQLRDMEVKIGEFPLTLTNANLVNKKYYKGTGYISWYPFGKSGWPLKINVEFDSLKINSDKIVYEGAVRSCHEEEEALSSYIPYDIFDDCNFSSYVNSGNAEALGNKVDEYLQNNASIAQYYKYAQSGAKFIDDMIENQISVNLPLSLKKPLGDGGITLDSSPIDIQILSATFSPTTAAVSVLGMLAMPNSNYIDSDVAVFGAPRICIGPESFVPEGVTIALLSDFTLVDPETQFRFNLKAPSDFIGLDDGCSMTFSSNGLDSLCFEADMTVPGLIKADDKGNIIENETPAITIRAFFRDWDNWLGTLAMDNFQVEEAAGFTFIPGGSGISYDHSMTHNPKNFKLPDNDGAIVYDKKAAECDKNILHWQGLHIDKVGLLLPSFFDEEDGSPIEISMNNLLYDKAGNISFKAKVAGAKDAPIVKAHTSKAGGWGISLESVDVNIISNQFASSNIIGGIEAPIIGGEWQYKTTMQMAEKKKSKGKGLDIKFTMDPRENPSFDFFLAKLELNKENTGFTVHNFEDETDVELLMAGKITIGGLEDVSKKIPLDFSISGIEFTGMRLANYAPEKKSEQSTAAQEKFAYTFKPICEGEKKGDLWFDLGTWSLASPGKQLGPFNFTLEHFGIASKTKSGDKLTGVNIVGSVGLLGESGTFTATAGVTVWAKLDIKDIKNISVDYAETTLDKIGIKSEFGGCKVDGMLEFSETDERKGYAGSLEFVLPGNLFTMTAEGGFFKCTDEKGKFMQAYFAAEVGSASGIPMGPIALNNIAGGFYFNTSLSNTDDDSPLKWTKTAARDVHGGMFGLGICTTGMERGLNAKVKMIVVYDAAKNRLSTFRMTGKMHALCVTPTAEDGLINADCSLVYQNLSSKEGGKYLQLNITVDAGGDMDAMCEAFTGQKIEIPDVTAGLEEMEDKSGSKNKEAADRKPKVSCGVHLSLDFKVTMKPDDYVGNFKTKWHLYLGQPGDGSYESEQKSRCSITLIDFQAGGKDDPIAVWGKIWANAYLCIGNELPNDGQLPPIPSEIQEFLNGKDASGNSQSLSNKADEKRKNAVSNFDPKGNGGVMFGAQAGGDFGVNAVICYARASLLAGFDIALKSVTGTCNGKKAGGKGGFYGTGQVYALAKGEMGLMINLWIFKGKIPLIDVGLGALLQGGFPNPSWAYGKVKAKCKLLGGLIKFNGSLTLEVGEVCYPDAGNPLDDIEIFGDMTPGDHDKDMDTAWKIKDQDDGASCYSTLGFTTNMAIGARLDLVDVNKANRMAGRDGDPEEYYGNCHRAYKFYLNPQTELYSFGNGTTPSSKYQSVSMLEYSSHNQEDYTITVPDGKLAPRTYYMMVMKGYAKEIVNGREQDPIYNDESTNYKDVARPWSDADTVYFHTTKLPNNINQDVVIKFPNSDKERYYTDEFVNPELHLKGSRVCVGDDIFDPVKYDIRARIEKYEHGLWVPADASVMARSKSGYYVDQNGDVDYFTVLNSDGSVAESQHDPFSDTYHVQYGTKTNGGDVYRNVPKATGLAQERLHRYVNSLDAMMSGTKSIFGSSALYTKYATLKWIPESYHSLLLAIDYYKQLLIVDQKTFSQLSQTVKTLDALKTEITTTTYSEPKSSWGTATSGGVFKSPITVTDEDILFTECPVERTISDASQAAQALKDVTAYYNAGFACVDKGLGTSRTTRKAATSLNPKETVTVKDSTLYYYKQAQQKFSNVIPNIYCTAESNSIKKYISSLNVLTHEADSLADAVAQLKTMRSDVWTNKVNMLGLMADARTYANPNHTLEQYREEMEEPLTKSKALSEKAAGIYAQHDYTKDIALDVAAMTDSLAVFDKWMTYERVTEGARKAADQGRKYWESVVSYMASAEYKSDSNQTRYNRLSDALEGAQEAYDTAVDFTMSSPYTTEAKGYRDAIADSIAGNTALSALGIETYISRAARCANEAKTTANDAQNMGKNIINAIDNPNANSSLQTAIVSRYTSQRDDLLAQCYEYVDKTLNVYYDANTDFRKVVSIKTDYTANELASLSSAAKQDIENAQKVKDGIAKCKAYADQAQGYYDEANKQALSSDNIWNVVVTNRGSMSEISLIKAVIEGLSVNMTTAKGVVENGYPVTVLKGVSRTTADDYVENLTAAGAKAKVVKSTASTGTVTYTATLENLGSSQAKVIEYIGKLDGYYVYDDFTTKLIAKDMPADMLYGLSQAQASTIVNNLNKIGAKASMKVDDQSSNGLATLTTYNVVVTRRTTATVTKDMCYALMGTIGSTYSEAYNILSMTMPITVAEGLTKTKAEELVSNLKSAKCTAKYNEVTEKSYSDYTRAEASRLAQGEANGASYSVVITNVGDNKLNVIKAVREITELGLKQAQTLVEGATPIIVKKGLTLTEADAAVAKLTAAGAKAEVSGKTTTQASSSTSTSLFTVVITAVGDGKIAVIKAYREITGTGLADAKKIIEGPTPIIVKEGLSKADADAAVAKLTSAGATVEARGAATAAAETISDAWYILPTDDLLAMHLSTVPGVAEAHELLVEPETSSPADPDAKTKATAKADAKAGAPAVPGVPSAAAASIISNVASTMNAKTGANAPRSTAAEPTHASATPSPVASAATAAIPAGETSTSGLVYDPNYAAANEIVKSADVFDKEHGNLTYYANAASVANSKVLSIPVTYHCGEKQSNGSIKEVPVRTRPDIQPPYHWLTIDGVNLMDYLNNNVQKYRIIIEQVDKDKLQNYLNTLKKEVTYTDEATTDDSNKFLDAKAGTAETSTTIDLEAFMANYYQEMNADALFTTEMTTEESEITNKEESSKDMFVQQIYEWPISVADYYGKGLEEYKNFAEYAKTKLVKNNAPINTTASNPKWFSSIEGMRPVAINYTNTSFSPRELAMKSDSELFSSYVYYDPLVWLAYVGSYAFFNSRDIYDHTDFLENDIYAPASLHLRFESTPYRLHWDEPKIFTTEYTPGYSSGSSYYSSRTQTWYYYSQGAMLIKDAGVCYTMPTYNQCLGSNIVRATGGYSRTWGYQKKLWTVADAMEEQLALVSDVMKSVREYYGTFRTSSDKTRRADIQSWVSSYNANDLYSNGVIAIGKDINLGTKTNGNYTYGTTKRSVMPKYQPYLMGMIDWWYCHGEKGDRKKYNDCFGERYGTAEARPDGRYSFKPLFIAGGYKRNDSTISFDYQFNFDWYCNNVKSIQYEFFRANCYDTKNQSYDVDQARANGFTYTITQQNPLNGVASNYKLDTSVRTINAYK